MRILALLLLVMLLPAADVYPMKVGQKWRYMVAGKPVVNTVLEVKVVAGERWFRTREFGITYWLTNRPAGTFMTHADLGKGEQPTDAFMLFPRQPKIGQAWNPDGVPIKVLAIDDVLQVGGQRYRCALYSYNYGQKDNVLLWFANGLGVVRQVEARKGRILIYELQVEEP